MVGGDAPRFVTLSEYDVDEGVWFDVLESDVVDEAIFVRAELRA